MQRLGSVGQVLHGKTQRQRVCKHAAGRLFEKNRSCPFCRSCSADIQCVLDFVSFSWSQIDLGGSALVPANGFSRPAPFSPGHAAARIPPRRFLPACQLEGAAPTGLRPTGWRRAGWRRAGERRTGGRRTGLRLAGRRRCRGKRTEFQHLAQSAFQQHLVLGDHLDKSGHTFVDSLHILRPVMGICTQQSF